MPVVDLSPPSTSSNSPVRREGSHAIYSGGGEPIAVLFTGMVPAPGGVVVRGVVESSLSTYLKLMHKMGILRFAEDQVVVTGFRKWFRGVSTILTNVFHKAFSTKHLQL